VWYDYWTGARLDRRSGLAARDLEIRDTAPAALQPVMVQPGPGELPVYVRAGSIVPLSPLVQSTDEKPSGPLTLRVFPGDNCAGEIYQDDGISYDFERGNFLRMHVSCSTDASGAVTVQWAKPEGSFQPWWSSVRIEVVGFSLPAAAQSASLFEATPLGVAATLPYTAAAQSITFQATPR
jgi:alpha-glucosidase